MKDKVYSLETNRYDAKYNYKGNIARRYNKLRISESKWIKEQDIFDSILGSFRAGTCIIDVPLGTGRFIPFYKKYNLECQGVDISDDMLREARTEAAFHKYDMQFIKSSADKLPQADSTCDYVICARLLNWVPLPILETMVREFCRVSRAGLVLEIRVSSESVNHKLEPEPRKSFLKHASIFIKETVKGVFKGEPTDFYLHDSDSVTRLFDSQGLKIVNTYTVDNAINKDRGLQTHLNIYDLRK
jgi:ubiquinone/menaquinone biosynthesis C-methylase UbiE